MKETIAESGPGIPDDALVPGEELPDAVPDDEIERIGDKLDELGTVKRAG